MTNETGKRKSADSGTSKAQLHLQVDPQMLDNIDRVASELGLSRSGAARLLINFAVKEKEEGNLVL